MLLCVVWREQVQYIDITNGNVVKKIPLNYVAVSAALDTRTGVVAICGAGCGIVHYYAPAYS